MSGLICCDIGLVTAASDLSSAIGHGPSGLSCWSWAFGPASFLTSNYNCFWTCVLGHWTCRSRVSALDRSDQLCTRSRSKLRLPCRSRPKYPTHTPPVFFEKMGGVFWADLTMCKNGHIFWNVNSQTEIWLVAGCCNQAQMWLKSCLWAQGLAIRVNLAKSCFSERKI